MTEQDFEYWYTTGRMPINFDIDEFKSFIKEIKAKAWQEGRDSLALDMVKPSDSSGMKPSSRNPYEES